MADEEPKVEPPAVPPTEPTEEQDKQEAEDFISKANTAAERLETANKEMSPYSCWHS